MTGTTIDAASGNAECLNSLGYALQHLGRMDEAIGCFKRALDMNPDYALALNNLGTVYKDLGRLDEAMDCYNHALKIDPESAEAHNNKGITLDLMGRLGDAVASYSQALAIQPDYAGAQNNLGKAYMSLGRLDDALTCYRQALKIQPDLAVTFSNLLMCLNYQADISNERLFAEHQLFEQWQAPRVFRLTPSASGSRDPERVLRIGLVSGDLRLHSVAFFLLPVLEQLDRRQFQICCYARNHLQDELTDQYCSAYVLLKNVSFC